MNRPLRRSLMTIRTYDALPDGEFRERGRRIDVVLDRDPLAVSPAPLRWPECRCRRCAP